MYILELKLTFVYFIYYYLVVIIFSCLSYMVYIMVYDGTILYVNEAYSIGLVRVIYLTYETCRLSTTRFQSNLFISISFG